jgi:hypothetical protein
MIPGFVIMLSFGDGINTPEFISRLLSKSWMLLFVILLIVVANFVMSTFSKEQILINNFMLEYIDKKQNLSKISLNDISLLVLDVGVIMAGNKYGRHNGKPCSISLYDNNEKVLTINNPSINLIKDLKQLTNAKIKIKGYGIYFIVMIIWLILGCAITAIQ